MTAMNDALSILEDSLRGAPIIWKGDYPYFIHPISDGIPRMDPEVLKAATELIVGTTDWEGVDLIVSVEAMGLPLLASVGNATGIPTVVIRKRSYGMEGEVSVDVSTGYSSSTIFINDISQEKGSLSLMMLSLRGDVRAAATEARRHGSHSTRCRYCHREGRWSGEAKSGAP